MNIPKSLLIGKQRYEVHFDQTLAASNSFGRCNSVDLRLSLDPNVPESRQEQTLVHEVIEAANADYSVGLKHQQIDLLELALYQITEDNPELFAPRKK